MTYSPPSIGPAGLTVPTYQDILADNILQFQKIYGSNQYLSEDSPQYQFISALSLKMADTMAALQYSYNQSSPLTAVGAGLDRIVKLNGIARLPYTYSTALLTLTGTAGAVIANGVAQDSNGNQWLLPASVTIPSGGTLSGVLATCTTAGNVVAEPGTITIIGNPQAGWLTVTNPSAAIPGNPVETDSQLRARQAISVSLPSQTMLDGVIAAIAAVAGVTRYNVVENDTNETDGNGNPPHSLTAVVEGGTELAVATAIYEQRGIGCYTNGSTAVNITDPETLLVTTIRFDLPTYVPIYVSLSIHALTGFTSAMPALVQQAITNYLNELQIGEIVTLSALYAAAMAVAGPLTNPAFSIRALTMGLSPSPSGTGDISMEFDQVAEGISSYVVVSQV